MMCNVVFMAIVIDNYYYCREKELELKNLRESLEKEIEELKKIIQKLREQLR